METNTEATENLEIELDDDTAKIASILAEERGITVEELLQQVLTDALESGYFDNPENITVNDSLDV
jgi:predicted DNA binding protein